MFGILNCAKPSGITSRDLVNLVQRRIRPVKVGHAGTLDPLATGVLLLPVGAAVRLTSYLHQLPKTYVATFRLGCHTPSGDLETEPIPEESPVVPSATELLRHIGRMQGLIQQVPPAYSAVRVAGQRAYRLAREGAKVALPPRTVFIHQIEVVTYDYPQLGLRIVCGSGTYIRSVGVDLAAACGTGAVMTQLTRTAIGPFWLEHAVDPEALQNDPLESHLQPAASGLPHLPRIQPSPPLLRRIMQGQVVKMTDAPAHCDQTGGPETMVLDSHGEVRAIAVPVGNGWRAKRCFPSADSEFS